ncbi:restriction endonuclease subunit S [Ancylobacter pratisalsi]|uniref:Restriction endonuclease subunit S n=1 Tax=Ancylobacter pratisalsi TaxID=1745854 RepID=A0A6P1YQY1_9HYPH|nr:restriction endonuclease subunit S [Ancylobacter pratisalsi]QIB35789.1 restriction endonuclease subunit S [Ancylobacter pratisalsi]
MIDGLRPYVEMRPSGLPWLGDVPAHWDILRAKRLLIPTQEPARSDDEIVTCFRDGQVTLRKNRRSSGFMIALLEQGYQGVRVGQLVVHSMDAFAGAIGVSDSDGKCTPEYIVCAPRADRAIPEYYSWVLRQAARTGYILASCPAVRERAPRLRYPDLGELRVPVPPPDEQRLIVRFLDWHGAQTAKLIRARKKIIALLKEQKQAIIHRAVTRGLDPNVRFKPSGIPWLGDVPERWEVKRLRRLATKFGSGVTPKGGATSYTADGVIFLRSQNVHFDGLRLQDVARIPPSTHDAMKGTHVRACDVLLNITGASIGRACAVPYAFVDDANVNQHVCIIRVKSDELVPEFLAAVISTPIMQREIRFEQNGASREGLTLDAIKSFAIPLPPLAEQRRILESIKLDGLEWDRAALRYEREIALIQEFRTRLIADVVTGKLDVRAAAASLPETVEIEATDEMVEDDDLDEAIDNAENEEVAA